MGFKRIPDAWVAAYAPLTARLLRRFWNVLEERRIRYLQANDLTGAIASTGSWLTAAQLPLYVADLFVGAGSPPTRVELEIDATCDATPSGGVCQYRLELGGATSNVENLSDPTGVGVFDTFTFTLDCTPTANAVAQINLQMFGGGAGFVEGTMKWNRGLAASSLLRSLPVAA